MRQQSQARVTGPLEAFADGYRLELAGLGFRPGPIETRVREMAWLSRWVVGKGISLSELTVDLVEEFIVFRRGLGRWRPPTLRSLGLLLGHLRDREVIPSAVTTSLTPQEELLTCYRRWLVVDRGLAPSTVRRYEGLARRFLAVWSFSASGGRALVSRLIQGSCACPIGHAVMALGLHPKPLRPSPLQEQMVGMVTGKWDRRARSSAPPVSSTHAAASSRSPIHALQRSAGNRAICDLLQVQRRAPDVSHNGYESFYLRGMVPVPRGEVRVQFHQAPGASTATFALWYQETGTLRQVSFTPMGRLRPNLLREDHGVSQFDLDGDGTADVHLIAQPNDATRGLDFVATLPGGLFFRMPTVPSGSPPRRGIPFGTLPDGRNYYLVPGTSYLPGGPRFVDDRNIAVNPALEARGAGVLRAAGTGYLLGYALILSVVLAGIAIEGAAAAEVATAATSAGAGGTVTLSSGQMGTMIGWGTSQSAAAVATTEAVTASLTTQTIRGMVARGLTREWVAAQLALYEAAVASGGAKLINQQLLPRLALMRRLLELWPR